MVPTNFDKEIKMSTIPAGYQLHIHSWEGDADFSRVEIVSGLTIDDVYFYLELLPYFNSSNGWGKLGHGGESFDGPDFIQFLDKLLTNHPNISDSTREQWTISEDELPDIDDEEYDVFEDEEDIDLRSEIMYERVCDTLLGYIENQSLCGESLLRVYSKHEVYFVEKPIIDVTDQFKKPL